MEAVFAADLRVPGPWRRAALGEQLRALRLERGMSQRHLAEGAGVAQSRVSRLEGGADAKWEIWRRLFLNLGYEISIVAHPADEGVEDLILDEIQERRDREELGRSKRWG